MSSSHTERHAMGKRKQVTEQAEHGQDTCPQMINVSKTIRLLEEKYKTAARVRWFEIMLPGIITPTKEEIEGVESQPLFASK